MSAASLASLEVIAIIAASIICYNEIVLRHLTKTKYSLLIKIRDIIRTQF